MSLTPAHAEMYLIQTHVILWVWLLPKVKCTRCKFVWYLWVYLLPMAKCTRFNLMWSHFSATYRGMVMFSAFSSPSKKGDNHDYYNCMVGRFTSTYIQSVFDSYPSWVKYSRHNSIDSVPLPKDSSGFTLRFAD